MNELDWWIASQWEMFKIKEGKTGLEFNKTDKEGNVLTVDSCLLYTSDAADEL